VARAYRLAEHPSAAATISRSGLVSGDARRSGPAELLAVFCANVIHIAPWRVSEGLFAGAGRYLRSDGGCFSRSVQARGQDTAMSNAVFDTSLREQDADWGVRDIADIEKLALAWASPWSNRANARQQYDLGLRRDRTCRRSRLPARHS